MIIIMWLANLFSLFSCFGALIVLIFAAVKSKDKWIWKILAIISIYVFSYASGMMYLIINFGFSIPEIRSMDIIPESPGFSYFLKSLLYLIQFWFIISVTNEYFSIKSRIIYVLFSPLVLAGFFIPDFLLLLKNDFLLRNSNLFIIFRLSLAYLLMEYPLITSLLKRKEGRNKLKSWLLIIIFLFAALIAPLMFVEDLLSLYKGMVTYNLIEAIGFLLLMTTVMITGILNLSSRGTREIDTISLLDVSREYGLTDREMDVLKELIASSNASYKEIALTLNISPETVKTHVSRIYKKIGVSAKQELKYKIREILD